MRISCRHGFPNPGEGSLFFLISLVIWLSSLLVVLGLAMGGLLELAGPDFGCSFPEFTPE